MSLISLLDLKLWASALLMAGQYRMDGEIGREGEGWMKGEVEREG